MVTRSQLVVARESRYSIWRFAILLAFFSVFMVACSDDSAITKQYLHSAKTKQNSLTAEAKAANWIWPTRGKIVKTFFEGGKDKKGVEIAGHVGQPVVASVAGKVMYSGAGLNSYGNLIIIKYNESFLAVYGLVKNSLVKEGEIVAQGEKIAELDTNAKGRAVLHFEIRHNGKAVDPLLYLKV